MVRSSTLEKMELIFEIRYADEGGYSTPALGHAIFTEAETWDALRANVLEAITLKASARRERLFPMNLVQNDISFDFSDGISAHVNIACISILEMSTALSAPNCEFIRMAKASCIRDLLTCL